VGGQSGRGGISDESSADDTNVALVDTVEHLGDGLDLRVIKWVWRGVSVDTESVD
jgi:hypothetical protein